MPEAPADPGGPPSWVLRLLSLTTYVGLLGFAVAEIVQVVAHGTVGLLSATLLNALAWVVGVNALIIGSGHLTFPDPIADAIGWPRRSPFQWEVGLTGLLIGVLGVMAPGFDRGFQLATVIAFSIFYLGAAVGHVRQMVTRHNIAPGNAGFIFWFDLVAPARGDRPLRRDLTPGPCGQSAASRSARTTRMTRSTAASNCATRSSPRSARFCDANSSICCGPTRRTSSAAISSRSRPGLSSRVRANSTISSSSLTATSLPGQRSRRPGSGGGARWSSGRRRDAGNSRPSGRSNRWADGGSPAGAAPGMMTRRTTPRYRMATVVVVGERGRHRDDAAGRLVHPALFYADDRAYLEGTVPFLREGLEAGQPVMMAAPPRRSSISSGRRWGRSRPRSPSTT